MKIKIAIIKPPTTTKKKQKKLSSPSETQSIKADKIEIENFCYQIPDDASMFFMEIDTDQ